MRFILLAALLALAPPAAAQTALPEAAAWCARRDPATPLDRAVAGCTWLIRFGLLDPRNMSIAHSNRGGFRIDLNETAAALADLNEAIRLDPRNSLAFNGRGNLRSDQGDRIGAMADYDEAIRLDPRSRHPFNNRGNLHRARGSLWSAVADYDEALRIDPAYAHALANRCIARQRLGQDQAARQDCDAAIAAAGPANSWPHTARGGLALLAHDLAAGAADITEALHRDPGDAYALHLRSLLRARQGDGAGSAADAAAAKARKPRIADLVIEAFGPAIGAP